MYVELLMIYELIYMLVLHKNNAVSLFALNEFMLFMVLKPDS